MISGTDFRLVFSRALLASQQSSCRYQIYGRKNHGVWGYCIAPTFKASRHQELAAMALESKTLDQVLPDSLVVLGKPTQQPRNTRNPRVARQ